MAVIVYNPIDSARFNVPVGVYLTRFLGTADKKPFDDPRFLKPGEQPRPRLGWRFEVVGPPGNAQMGQVIEQETGTSPSSKSGLVRLLNMMLANQGGLQPGQSVDPASFVGRVYQVQWAVNPASEKGNPHIAALMEVAAAAATTPPPRTITNPHAPPVPSAHAGQLVNAVPPGTQPVQSSPLVPPGTLPVPPAPPPRRGAQSAPRPGGNGPPVQRYYVNTGAAPAPLMTLAEVRVYIDQNHVAPKDLDLCPEGTSEWKPADTFGFEEPIPY